MTATNAKVIRLSPRLTKRIKEAQSACQKRCLLVKNGFPPTLLVMTFLNPIW